MSVLIPCPQCGARSVYEFRFGGEVRPRPAPEASETEWIDFTYFRNNTPGVQTEWWYHRDGCREWLQVIRNTVTNEVSRAMLPGDNAA